MVMSCPSRGTRIEIPTLLKQYEDYHVVPLPGHVDRNIVGAGGDYAAGASCPSRGTWIEMFAL